MGKRHYRALKLKSGRRQALAELRQSEKGQALAELPYVVLVSCLLILMMLQPAVFLYTQMALGQIASGVARIAATEEATLTSSKERLIRSYVADKLEGLPKGSAFRIPGTLRVDVKGNAYSERIEVEVRVDQKPLPLLAPLMGVGVNGNVTVTGKAVTSGTRVGVEGTAKNAPTVYGNVPAK